MSVIQTNINIEPQMLVSEDSGNLLSIGTDQKLCVQDSEMGTGYVRKTGDMMTGSLKFYNENHYIGRAGNSLCIMSNSGIELNGNYPYSNVSPFVALRIGSEFVFCGNIKMGGSENISDVGTLSAQRINAVSEIICNNDIDGNTLNARSRIDTPYLEVSDNIVEGGIALSDKYAAKNHTHSGGTTPGNEEDLLSSIPHVITISGTQLNPVVGGDGASIPGNKTFLVIDSNIGSNATISMWTPLTGRMFYVVNKSNHSVTLLLSATQGGTQQTLNIDPKRGIRFLISQIGISNRIEPQLSFNENVS